MILKKNCLTKVRLSKDSQGNMLEFYDLSFAGCDADGATLVLDYDGQEATASLY